MISLSPSTETSLQRLAVVRADAPHRVHLTALDGWRGISISLVLAAHLLPLGPKVWQLNETAARLGMALFFTLSGFLIARLLLADPNIQKFLVRRVLRIVPLAWLVMAISFPLTNPDSSTYLPNLFFYANLPPIRLATVGSHFWSLCVEMQFYLAAATIVLLLKKGGLYVVLPLLCVGVTILRVRDGAHLDIVTWRRVDEILAGVVLALFHAHSLGRTGAKLMRNFYFFLILAVTSSHPLSGPMNYLRPYFTAALVGTTLYYPPEWIRHILATRLLRYLATISYALYIIHGMLPSWFSSGETLVKYAKRPLMFAVTFALAHLSTFHFEPYWIALGKRLTETKKVAAS
jgi:peptidoglycan/LPS O-acetylase OafA/YrhL